MAKNTLNPIYNFMALSDTFSGLFNAAQGIGTEFLRSKLNLTPASDAQRIAERQDINALNGSGAPSTAAAQKNTSSETQFVFGDAISKKVGFNVVPIAIAFALGMIAWWTFVKTK
jgi:hypothetical protein